GSRRAQGRGRRSRPLACRSCAAVRRAAPAGSAPPAAPTPRPADRSDTRRPRVDKFDGAPPSTSLFAITASLSPANHAIRGDTADFWVKLLARNGDRWHSLVPSPSGDWWTVARLCARPETARRGLTTHAGPLSFLGVTMTTTASNT